MNKEQKEALLEQLNEKAEYLRLSLSRSDKYVLFAESYARCTNATKAAIFAGYSEKTAYSMGSKLLRDIEAIGELVNVLKEIERVTRGIEQDDLTRQLMAIANSDIRNYVKMEKGRLTFRDMNEWTDDMAAAVEAVKHGKHGIELKLHNKLYSIDALNKHLGFYEKDNRQKGEAIADVIGIMLPDNGRDRAARGADPA